MSASLLNEDAAAPANQHPRTIDAEHPGERPICELSDLVDIYAVAEYLPPADWVTRLPVGWSG